MDRPLTLITPHLNEARYSEIICEHHDAVAQLAPSPVVELNRAVAVPIDERITVERTRRAML